MIGVIRPSLCDDFGNLVVFMMCVGGGAVTSVLALVSCSLEASINLKSDKSRDQIGERDR